VGRDVAGERATRHLQPPGVPRRDRDAGAVLGRESRDGKPDAAGAAHDDDLLALTDQDKPISAVSPPKALRLVRAWTARPNTL